MSDTSGNPEETENEFDLIVPQNLHEKFQNEKLTAERQDASVQTNAENKREATSKRSSAIGAVPASSIERNPTDPVSSSEDGDKREEQVSIDSDVIHKYAKALKETPKVPHERGGHRLSLPKQFDAILKRIPKMTNGEQSKEGTCLPWVQQSNDKAQALNSVASVMKHALCVIEALNKELEKLSDTVSLLGERLDLAQTQSSGRAAKDGTRTDDGGEDSDTTLCGTSNCSEQMVQK